MDSVEYPYCCWNDQYGVKYYCKCKKCGKEADVDASMVLTSYPPQYAYFCSHCDEGGYVLCSETYSHQNADLFLDMSSFFKGPTPPNSAPSISESIGKYPYKYTVSGVTAGCYCVYTLDVDGATECDKERN